MGTVEVCQCSIGHPYRPEKVMVAQQPEQQLNQTPGGTLFLRHPSPRYFQMGPYKRSVGWSKGINGLNAL